VRAAANSLSAFSDPSTDISLRPLARRSTGEYEKAASLLAKVLGQDKRAWEDWVFLFAQKQQLEAIIPFVPTAQPQLGDMVYELILAFLLQSDRPVRNRLVLDQCDLEPRADALDVGSSGAPPGHQDVVPADLQGLKRRQRNRGRPFGRARRKDSDGVSCRAVSRLLP
jgi:hypothetical protein